MKFAIEIADNRNRNAMFAPTESKLRGHWSSGNNPGQSSHAFLSLMPTEIPGQVVFVDTDKRICKITDPLGFPENEHILRQINNAMKEHPTPAVMGAGIDGNIGATPDVVHEKCTPDMMKTWIYWMRKIYDAKTAREFVNLGQLPPVLDTVCEMPGRAFVSQFNSMKNRDYTNDGEDEVVKTGPKGTTGGAFSE